VSIRTSWKQVRQLIAKNRRAAGLEHHDRRSCFDRGTHHIQNLVELLFRFIEHSVVEQRTPAAKTLLRDEYAIAGGFQNVDRGLRCVRKEMVIKRIRPQSNDGALVISAVLPDGVLLEPISKCLSREEGNAALLRNAGRGFCES